MCTHNLCFEQKQENFHKFSNEILDFLQPKKILYIAWTCIRNVVNGSQGKLLCDQGQTQLD